MRARRAPQVGPYAGTTCFDYNVPGELIAQEHADGSRIDHQLDVRGRVWRRMVRGPGAGDAQRHADGSADAGTAATARATRAPGRPHASGWSPPEFM